VITLPSPVIVLEADVNGLGVIRSLGSKGIRVWALDSDRLAPGLYSRFVERRLICPDPVGAPDAFIEALKKSIEGEPAPPVLFPTSDAYVHVLASRRTEFDGRCTTWVPGRETIEPIVDKRRQYETAQSHGIPMPHTRIFKDPDEVARYVRAGDLPLPCVLKPAYSTRFWKAFGFKAIQAASLREVQDLCDEYFGLGHPLIAQELIPGGPEHLMEVMVFIRKDGTPAATFASRKLEHFPADFGSGTIFQSIEGGAVRELALRVVDAFGFRGLGHVEFKWDSRDCEFKFLELNPRTSVSSLHPLACGTNFPWLAYLDSVGLPLPSPPLEYKAGEVWVFPEVRVLRMRRVRMPRAAPSRWPWARRYTQAVLSPRDPLPEAFLFLRAIVRDVGRATTAPASRRRSSPADGVFRKRRRGRQPGPHQYRRPDLGRRRAQPPAGVAERSLRALGLPTADVTELGEKDPGRVIRGPPPEERGRGVGADPQGIARSFERGKA
jgi:predicted ATP-grasp superfamily ATP-dependent carboligase